MRQVRKTTSNKLSENSQAKRSANLSKISSPLRAEPLNTPFMRYRTQMRTIEKLCQVPQGQNSRSGSKPSRGRLCVVALNDNVEEELVDGGQDKDEET
jgi:hypothetical protein